MSFVNWYQPSPEPAVLPDDELYGPEPYDINFAFPLHPDTLESDKVRLTPFVPREHAQPYWAAMEPLGVEPFRYFPFCPATLPAFLTVLETQMRRPPETLMLAIVDKTQGALAGVLALVNTRGAHLSAELGFALVFPAFRGTHVTRTAVGLVLRYLLQLPAQDPPGLGFRRVAWTAHPQNAPSNGLATRMGMQLEGIMRWPWVLPHELAQEGQTVREGDPLESRLGRHSVIYSLCWDDWENGGREQVGRLIQ